MDQEIIQEFKLIETNKDFGQTYKYGVKVYQSSEFPRMHFAMCNSLGEPRGNVMMIWNDETKKYKYCGVEFMLDFPYEHFTFIMKETAKEEPA